MAFGDADASTPAFAVANSVSKAVTTASFTPPADSVLLAFAFHDTAGGNTTATSQVTDSRGLTWTRLVTHSKQDDGTGANNGHLAVSYAIVPAGAPVSMTVTTTGTLTNNPAGLYVHVVAGADLVTPSDVAPTEGHNNNAVISIATTANVTAGTRAFLIATDWNLAAAMTAGAGQTALVSSAIGAPDMRVAVIIANAVTASTGVAETMGTGGPSTGNANNYATIVLRPATGGPTPKSLSEAGAAADTVTTAAAVPLADTGSAADTVTTTAAVPLAHAASAADTLTTAAAVPLADTGSAAEALGSIAATVPLTHTGAAADTLSVGAAVALSDTGAASDALVASIAIAVAETGAAADALTTAAAVPLADAGSAVEALAGITAAVPLADTGSAVDTLTVTAVVALADAGAAVDTAIAGIAIAIAEAGAAADTLTVSAAGGLLETGSAVDALSVTATCTLPDTGSAVDSLTVTAVINLADAAAAVDAVVQSVLVQLADSGSAVDTLIVVDDGEAPITVLAIGATAVRSAVNGRTTFDSYGKVVRLR